MYDEYLEEENEYITYNPLNSAQTDNAVSIMLASMQVQSALESSEEIPSVTLSNPPADGDDVIEGDVGNDGINGEGGIDTISYASATESVHIELAKNFVYNDGFGTSDYIVNVENIIGSDFDDFLVGDVGANEINSGGGSDTIYGHFGDDTLHGGSENDLIFGDLQTENANDGNDTINAGAGDDTISGQGGDDTLNGDDGNDEIFGGTGNDILNGGAGNDVLYGDFTTETANDSNDILNGGAGNDVIFGGGGGDTITSGAGVDVIWGGGGVDTLDYTGSAGSIHANLQTRYINEAAGTHDYVVDVENIIGSGFGDVIVGTADVNTLDGGAGADTIYGNFGEDVLLGGDGDDLIYGDLQTENANDANDTLDGGAGNDILAGNGGDDIFISSSGNDTIYGGTGTDVIDHRLDISGVVVELRTSYAIDGTGGRDTLIGVENIQGSDFNDILVGDNNVNEIWGNLGVDTIYGLGGIDTLHGGAGNDIIFGGDASDIINGEADADTLYGENGDDTINGGDGNDMIYGDFTSETGGDGNDIINDGAGDDIVHGGGGNDTFLSAEGADYIDGGAGIDTIDYTNVAGNSIYVSLAEYYAVTTLTGRDVVLNIENIIGTDANDFILGSVAENEFWGGAGRDQLNGYYGDDILHGGDGDDFIFGDFYGGYSAQDGADILNGGAGDDMLFGMGGIDTLNGGDGNDLLFYDPTASDTYNGDAGFDTLQLATGDSSNFTLSSLNLNSIEHVDLNNFNTAGDVANQLTFDISDISGLNAVNVLYVSGDENDSVIISNLDENADFINISLFDGKAYEFYFKNGNHLYIQLGLNVDGPGNAGTGDDSIITGTVNDDTLTGTSADEEILGLDGNDILNGGGGKDEFSGGGGNDTINGGADDDLANGDDGDDTLFGNGGDDILGGDDGNDIVNGGSGEDTLYGGSGEDTLYGGTERDTLYGGNDNDDLFGGDGNDVLSGEAGDDELYGETGGDLIYGGAGNDVLDGGANDEANIDFLYGGNDDDTLIYRVNDVYNGGAGNDTLQLTETDSSSLDFSASTFSYSSIENINLANQNNGALANTLTVNVANVLQNSDSDTLFITGDAGLDTVSSTSFNAAAFAGTVDRDGVTFNSYVSNGATLNVQADLNVNFFATIEIVADVFSTNEDQDLTINASTLLANDTTGFANDTLTVTSITSGTFGVVTLLSPGVWNYDPANNISGTDTLTYTVENTTGEVEQGTITIVISDVNDPLIAQDDHFERDNTNPFSGNVLIDNGNGADVDLDGDVITVTTVGTFLTNRGNTIELNADGSFVFIPTTNFSGSDFFDYTITDGNGATATARITAGISPEGAVTVPTQSLVEVLDDPNVGGYSNSELHSNGPYTGKTVSIAIETSADVNTRQVIYEQGGGTRGLNIFIENGEVHFAIWNYAEENWGYVETSASINASETMTVTLVSDGNIGGTGTITGYINGVEVSQESGVGLLYNHAASSIGRTDGSTVINNSSTSSANVFAGTINKISFHNDALDGSSVQTLSDALLSQNITPVLLVENAQIDTTENDPAINDSGPYAEKTLGATFTTGADINTTQVIYEQGGTVRGMNIFITAGRAYIAAWNFAEENWGYKEFSIAIEAQTQYTTTLILEGVQNETGSLTGYFDGVEVGSFNDVGFLYSHPGLIGFEQMLNGTVLNNTVHGGDGFAFTGTLETLVQYNDAVTDSNTFNQLQDFLNGDPGSSPYLDPLAAPSGIPMSNDDTLLYSDASENILGGDGFDTLIAAEGLSKTITSDSYDSIELIDLSQNNAPTQADDLMVNLDDVLSTESNVLSVLGDSVDEVISTDFTTADRKANITQDDTTYAVFQDSGATLQIELGMVLNGNTINQHF